MEMKVLLRIRMAICMPIAYILPGTIIDGRPKQSKRKAGIDSAVSFLIQSGQRPDVDRVDSGELFRNSKCTNCNIILFLYAFSCKKEEEFMEKRRSDAAKGCEAIEMSCFFRLLGFENCIDVPN
jgi:hypothetical protein